MDGFSPCAQPPAWARRWHAGSSLLEQHAGNEALNLIEVRSGFSGQVVKHGEPRRLRSGPSRALAVLGRDDSSHSSTRQLHALARRNMWESPRPGLGHVVLAARDSRHTVGAGARNEHQQAPVHEQEPGETGRLATAVHFQDCGDAARPSCPLSPSKGDVALATRAPASARVLCTRNVHPLASPLGNPLTVLSLRTAAEPRRVEQVSEVFRRRARGLANCRLLSLPGPCLSLFPHSFHDCSSAQPSHLSRSCPNPAFLGARHVASLVATARPITTCSGTVDTGGAGGRSHPEGPPPMQSSPAARNCRALTLTPGDVGARASYVNGRPGRRANPSTVRRSPDQRPPSVWLHIPVALSGVRAAGELNRSEPHGGGRCAIGADLREEQISGCPRGRFKPSVPKQHNSFDATGPTMAGNRCREPPGCGGGGGGGGTNAAEIFHSQIADAESPPSRAERDRSTAHAGASRHGDFGWKETKMAVVGDTGGQIQVIINIRSRESVPTTGEDQRE
ncbi:uncharacterized protein LOC144933451 [Lampetra fluviatilis]